MKKIILIGAGGHVRAVISTINQINKWKLIGIIDIAYNGNSETILGIKTIGLLKSLNDYSKKDTYIFLSIGDNQLRKEIHKEIVSRGFKLPNIIHPSSIIDNTAEIGLGNFIGAFVHIGPKVKIHECNIINTSANIEHETQIESFCQIAPGVVICGRCKLGKEVFIGANATIIDKIKIADNTLIGAGTIITKDILESGRTIVGNPGKPR
jgi:sugar O-acyltransferase (sialic acid O-acetyltransferase NeuD family)